MHEEDRLKEKLRAIEALYAGATTEGERDAAARARARVGARLAELQRETEVEWQFSVDTWSLRLLVALARRHGLRPYRYRRQRRSTVLVRATAAFVKETFLPEFEQMWSTLREHLAAVTERVVAEVVHADKSELAVIDRPRQIEAGGALPLDLSEKE